MCVACFLGFPSSSSLVCSAIFSEAEGVMGGKSSEKVFLDCCQSETGFPGPQNILKTTSLLVRHSDFAGSLETPTGVPYSWESLSFSRTHAPPPQVASQAPASPGKLHLTSFVSHFSSCSPCLASCPYFSGKLWMLICCIPSTHHVSKWSL